MNRSILTGIIILLIAVVGIFAYQAYREHDANTLDISVGKDGIKVD